MLGLCAYGEWKGYLSEIYTSNLRRKEQIYLFLMIFFQCISNFYVIWHP